MDCAMCQAPLPVDARYCPACGATARTAATGPTERLPLASADIIPLCPKCQQGMIAGFFPDFDDRTGGEPSLWAAGHPTRQAQTRQVLVSSDRLYRVVVYRCPGCGYLELYAPHQLG